MAEAPSCCELAVTSLGERSETLRWALARLPLASDAEAVHDARVALRRLRSASSGFADCLTRDRRWRRRLRRAEKALGALRDAEVRLELLDEVLGPVAVSRDRSDDPRKVGGPEGTLVVEGASALQPGLRGLESEARRVLADATALEIGEQRRQLTRRVLRGYQALASPPSLCTRNQRALPAAGVGQQQLPRLFKRAGRRGRSEADLHRRRVEIRKLRYRLELFAPVLDSRHQPVLQELRQVQGLLGRFHDLAVLSQWIEGSSRQLRHELRPALRRLALRVGLEEQVAKEAAESELVRLDDAGWWFAAQAACLGAATPDPT